MGLSVDDCILVELPRLADPRGSLTFVEYDGKSLPFPIRRAYWIYDVPGGEVRGGHAYRTLAELFIALSGSFVVMLDDGECHREVALYRSYAGLYVPPGIWREPVRFSTNGVCLVLASLPYDERDYIRDRDAFISAKQSGELP